MFYGGIFSVFLTRALTACKKEIIATHDEAQKETMLVERLGLTTDGKLLKFATLEAYEKAVDHEQAELQEEMLTSIKKASFPNYFSNSTVIEKNANAKEGQEMDDFLGQLLNKDGAVQIGEHIYKVDLQKEKVFVIEAKNSTSDYSDLINGRTSNKNVKEFSTDDDVLYIVRDGVSEKCGGIGYHSAAEYPEGYATDNYEYYLFSMDNFRGGIYFSFRMTFELLPNPNMWGAPTTTVSFRKEIVPHDIHIQFRPCNSVSNYYFSKGVYTIPKVASHSSKWVAASSSRNLNKISARARGILSYNGVDYYTKFVSIYVN